MTNSDLKTKIIRYKNKFAGSTVEYNPEKYRNTLKAINEIKQHFGSLRDEQIKEMSILLKNEAEKGVPLDELLEEAFALVDEAIRRVLKIEPFEEQILGAIAMHNGRLIEMQTGEGKTLTAVFAVYLNALSGRGCHVLTYNDYLAWRDAKWMGPVYEFLSLSVGFVKEGMGIKERKHAYNCDITYLTAKEAGFDFLRDSLCCDKSNVVQRDFNFVLVDEADSIMVDESRIPLIIAGSSDVNENKVEINFSQIARNMREYIDFEYDGYRRNIFLSDTGILKAETFLGLNNLFDECNQDLLTRLYCAIHAEYLLKKDVDYIIRNGKIELVDEFTGRVADKRRWPDGLQEAIEEKEGLVKQASGKILNSITLQHFFGLYNKICAMTATALPAESEFKSFYNLDITVIPTHKKCSRVDLPDLIFRTKEEKYSALFEEIIKTHNTGRPVLVGTASVKESFAIAGILAGAGIKTEILNAKRDEFEAGIIARAGKPGAVTISTNMAGRGTDIKLGGENEEEKELALSLGGLYVIGTNKHESSRIDYQLRGRAGRQGDPGNSRFFISLQDDLYIKYRIDELLPEQMTETDSPGVMDPLVVKEVDRVQRIIEGQNLEIKKTLCSYTMILEYQRKIMHKKRMLLLNRDHCMEFLMENMPESYKQVSEMPERDELIKTLSYGAILLHDSYWSRYLSEIADIRESIHLSRLGGKDPLTLFRKTTIELFEQYQSSYDNELLEIVQKIISGRMNSDLSDLGLKAPTATWTYFVNDNPFEGVIGMILQGNLNDLSSAMTSGPAIMVVAILKHFQKRRKMKMQKRQSLNKG